MDDCQKWNLDMQYAIIFVSFLFLISCGSETVTEIPSVIDLESSSLPNNTATNSDIETTTHLEVMEKAIIFYNTNEFCKDESLCRKTCDQLYANDPSQKNCKDLPVALVNRFLNIQQAYQSKNLAAIQAIPSFDMQAYIAFDSEAAKMLFQDIGLGLAQDLLAWIAYDWDTASVFQSEDLDHSLLKLLLSKIENEPIESLGKAVKDGRSFYEVAILRQNDFTLSWVHSFFVNECKGEQSTECLLGYYCDISRSLHEDTLTEIDKFKKLKTILKTQKVKNNQPKTLQNVCLT